MTSFSPPNHISYSQHNTYTNCPRNWYLGKVRHAEETQTWYLPIGTAVHQMIEEHLENLIVVPRTAEEVFYPLIQKQMLIQPDTTKWLAGGPEKDPVVEEKALRKVKDCFERALEFLEDWDVWEVEYDASGKLPGLEPEVKAFIDIIGEYKGKKKKWHGPGIVDWKTGSKKPSNNFQLETYSALLSDVKFADMNHRGGPFNGFWAMLDPNASAARPIDLSEVSPTEVGLKYQRAWRGMRAMMIEAKKAYMCKMCFNKDSCMEYSGITPQTIYYDRSHIDQPKF